MKNWKTTLCGVVAAASTAVGAKYPDLAPYCLIVGTLATTALGFFAKDSNVTGTGN